MKHFKNEDKPYFHQRHPNLPLCVSLISLGCSLIMLLLQIIVFIPILQGQ